MVLAERPPAGGVERTLDRVGEAGAHLRPQGAKIRRLQDDLGLNAAGVEVAMRLLDEIENLRITRNSRD